MRKSGLAVLIALLMLSSASAQEFQTQTLQDNMPMMSGTTTWSTAIKNPPYYTYEPQPDITAQELSEVIKLLLPALACRHYMDDCGVVDQIDKSPLQIKRHFVRHED